MKIVITPDQLQVLIEALRNRQEKCYNVAQDYKHPDCGDYYSETAKFWIEESTRARDVREYLEKCYKEARAVVKRIDATCGYREEYGTGEVRYYPDHTDNGECYKDDEAFDSGKGVCYIREAMFDQIREDEGRDYVTNWDLEKSDDYYTKGQIVEGAKRFFECEIPEGYPYTEKFIDWAAQAAYYGVDWQGIDVYFNEIDDFTSLDSGYGFTLPHPWEWEPEEK